MLKNFCVFCSNQTTCELKLKTLLADKNIILVDYEANRGMFTFKLVWKSVYRLELGHCIMVIHVC